LRVSLVFVVLVFAFIRPLEASSTESPKYMCGVVYGYKLTSEKKVIDFNFYPPMTCGGLDSREMPSLEWQQVACAYLTITDYVNSFEADKDDISYGVYWYSHRRPNVIFPTTTAGDSNENPVVYVKESAYLHSLVKNNEHPCNAALFQPSKLPNK
jgi:hypothetical protein